MLESLLLIFVSVWILFSLLLYFFQAGFVYYPYREIHQTPADIGLAYEDVQLTTRDNISLHGWYIPAENSRGTILFFHGNAGNISHRLDSIGIFNDLGLSVFIIDYRGYGKSAGKPTEKGTYLDADAAWDYLTQVKQIPSDRIIIFGRSLGSAVALDLVTRASPAGLIMESSFSSISDMGRHIYPFLPVSLLSRIHYDSLKKIPDINIPVLIIHSRNDDIVPFEHGLKLYQAAKQPRYFHEINGDHNNGFLDSGDHYINGLEKFLATHL